MPKSTPVYALISIDDKKDPRVEEFDMVSALKVRMTGIQANDPQYKLLQDGRAVSWDWSEPELIIGETVAPVKKTRAPRSDKGQARKVIVGRTRGFSGPDGEPGKVGVIVAEVKS